MRGLLVFGLVLVCTGAVEAQPRENLSLEQAIRRAVETNPRIGEASANRRAVDQEVRQVQGGLLPQVRLDTIVGDERNRRFNNLGTARQNGWRPVGGEASIVMRQLLFDGGTTINEIYRQMARSESAAWRTMERTELVALDVVEAYLDILRYTESIGIARQTIAAHQRILGNVQNRVAGGRAGVGDLQQVRERVQAAQAIEAELRIRLEEAKAAFRRSVGAEPNGLRMPARLAGLPPSRAAALEQTLANNPTLLAARSDVTAAQRQYDAAAGQYGPTVALELRGATGRDTNDNIGRYDETSARIVASWMLFDGGTRVARRAELAERIGENQSRLSALQRAAFESIDRAWGARENSGARINSLAGQARSAASVIAAYRSEYELGQRTLLDLLNAENGLFNARLSLAAARTVAVFADYQLLAATGGLLRQMRAVPPREARPTPVATRSVVPPMNLLEFAPR